MSFSWGQEAIRCANDSWSRSLMVNGERWNGTLAPSSSHTNPMLTAPVCVSLKRSKNVGCGAISIRCDASFLLIKPTSQPVAAKKCFCLPSKLQKPKPQKKIHFHFPSNLQDSKHIKRLNRKTEKLYIERIPKILKYNFSIRSIASAQNGNSFHKKHVCAINLVNFPLNVSVIHLHWPLYPNDIFSQKILTLCKKWLGADSRPFNSRTNNLRKNNLRPKTWATSAWSTAWWGRTIPKTKSSHRRVNYSKDKLIW